LTPAWRCLCICPVRFEDTNLLKWRRCYIDSESSSDQRMRQAPHHHVGEGGESTMLHIPSVEAYTVNFLFSPTLAYVVALKPRCTPYTRTEFALRHRPFQYLNNQPRAT
jgi:hypothetical protein